MRHLTTGECATFCQVASRTIHKWMDSGLLKGFLVPGSTHRRVPENNLVAFMLEHGMPVPEELQHLIVECTICASKFVNGQKCNCTGKTK